MKYLVLHLSFKRPLSMVLLFPIAIYLRI